MGRRVSKEGSGVISEMREKHELELENLTLTKHPFRTLHFFMLAMLQYLKRLATYILSKGALFVLLIVLVLAPGLLLVVTDGLHKKEFLNYARFVLWWVSLGVASSIGLGNIHRMHTSMLVRWQAAGKQGGWSTEHDTLILSKLQEQSATSRAQVHKEVSREAIVIFHSHIHTHMHGPSQKHAFWILVWSSTCNFDL